MGFSRKKPSLWLSRKTRSRLEGVKTLSSIVARKNPLVDSLATSKEIFDSTYRIINGKEEYPEASSDPLAKSLKNHSRRDRNSPVSKMEKWLLRDHVLSDLVFNVESDKEVG